MRAALRYGLRRGLFYGVATALTLLAVRPAWEAGQWIGFMIHGPGELWLTGE